ncbi:hypothetical protein SAMN06273572_10479 [Monaibacterium marinum]|uniref:Uncharacterized protein n=1 Tax=Pontivivens marinum TaxID=1690039 RepID=A0A2C9CS68_9RHOB|nr:hypothetical protein [Monaibacterium marinum]SOH94381.1 hypothetical protein SAMN06273572_10479 [Monaibacterium marinum]
MHIRTISYIATLLALAGCGGGGGGTPSIVFNPGSTPATGLTLAQLSDGEFSSTRNSGGISKSLRYREANPAAPAGESPDAIVARVLSDSRKLQGIQFTASSDTGLVNAVLNDQITSSDVQLLDGVYVATDFPTGTLELQALELGTYDSVLGGLWRYVPANSNPQTFVGGWHSGSLTDVANLPTGTNVIFTGSVLGLYVRNDNVNPGDTIPLVISEVTGDVTVEMNFITGEIVQGGNSAITNLTLTDLAGETLNDFLIINGAATAITDNTWDAELQAVNQSNDSTDFSAASDSDISGRFYGPGGATQEMGSAFRVREDGEAEILTGVFLAESTPVAP